MSQGTVVHLYLHRIINKDYNKKEWINWEAYCRDSALTSAVFFFRIIYPYLIAFT
jgi:hypothetical protein